ncbi:hypothetical protein [Acidihalobacter prosperus]
MAVGHEHHYTLPMHPRFWGMMQVEPDVNVNTHVWWSAWRKRIVRDPMPVWLIDAIAYYLDQTS